LVGGAPVGTRGPDRVKFREGRLDARADNRRVDAENPNVVRALNRAASPKVDRQRGRVSRIEDAVDSDRAVFERQGERLLQGEEPKLAVRIVNRARNFPGWYSGQNRSGAI